MAMRGVAELVYNRFVAHLPATGPRARYLRAIGADLGPNVFLFGGTEVLYAPGLSIAGNCHIGRFCQLDARGGIVLGTNVVIASHTLLITADHGIDDPTFDGRLAPITIGDRAWLASRVTVVKGVEIGEGAVVGAGSVVTADVPPWAIVAGVPARVVGERSPHQTYEIDSGPAFY
jgi:acetyltransferase-like isoleucine patch superfamily enzyme